MTENKQLKIIVRHLNGKFRPSKNTNKVGKKPQIKISWSKIVRETFVEFCAKTSLHGFRQIVGLKHDVGDPRLTKIFQILSTCVWSFMIVISIILAIFLIATVLLRYIVTPTITTIESSNYPVSDLPFPAVAICNINIVYRPNTLNISKHLLSRGISENRIESFFQDLQSLITFDLPKEDFKDIFNILSDDLQLNTNGLMKMLAKPCQILLYRCEWLTKIIDCQKYFRLEKTEVGYCCAFNYNAVPEQGINTTANRNASSNRIIHSASVGEDIGLRVYINLEDTYYMSTRKDIDGADILLFPPANFPQINSVASLSQPGKEISITVRPNTVGTAPEVESMGVDLRSCYFEDEQSLLISFEYSFESCVTECRAKNMLRICGCLPFFYPNADYLSTNHSYRICTLADNVCFDTNENRFYSLKSTGLNIASKEDSEITGLDCDCHPSCSATSYATDTFYMNRFLTGDAAHYKYDPNIESKPNLSLIKVYYKELSCMKYSRTIFMTWDNLLANVGGIFGLCLGGSIISLIEIGYFSSLKLYEKYLNEKYRLEGEAKLDNFMQNSNTNNKVADIAVWRVFGKGKSDSAIKIHVPSANHIR